MHRMAILMHMRTTLNIDDALLGRATQLSGLSEKTAVVRAGGNPGLVGPVFCQPPKIG